jgi:D-3-phosphoglycerate dehydrogenase
MYTIKTLNAISPVGLAKLPANQFEIDNEAAAPQGILVRSADMHDAPLPDSLLAIARAGAGTNNIPVEDCTNKGIVVFNTPGANANAVAELVVGALVAGSRNLVDAVNWAQTLKGRDTIAKDVEKGKKAFVGPELRGKTLGVIGLGAIGARVANAAVALGMEVLGYDPYISIDAAWSLSRSVQHCVTLGDMLPRCDYLTIHVPYLPTTRHTINAQTLAMCKDGVRVLNFARGELVDNAALLDALNSGKVAQYFCDFPTEELLGVKGVCCTPHLGASTPESETNCAVMAAAELSDYLKNGNIAHSVNLPDVPLGAPEGVRVLVIHENVPNMVATITTCVSAEQINIDNLVNKSRKDVAVTVMELSDRPSKMALNVISSIAGVIRVRVFG